MIGDTVGDPFKDTSSVALNPIIKFTTLFGLLAVELAVKVSHGSAAAEAAEGAKVAQTTGTTMAIGAVLLLVALVFVYRSFYNMRVKSAA